jgi:outer membrane protein assembly factor BamB
VGDVLIDLGVLPHGSREEEPPPAGRPRPARTTLAVLAVVLTTALAGAGAPVAPPRPLTIPAQLSDMVFPDAERYYVVSGTGGGLPGRLRQWVIHSYRLPDAALLSRTPATVTGPITGLRTVGNVLFVSYQLDSAGREATVALAADSGRVLWRYVARFVGLSPSRGLALLLDGNGGAEPLRWYGVNPATGSAVWSHDVPIGGSTDLAWNDNGPTRMVTATVAGRVEVRDPETGQITAAADLPQPTEWRRRGLYIWINGDLVLLGGRRGITAYSLNDLSPRWHSAVDLTEVFVLPVCGEALCLFGRFGGMHVIDRVTGQKRWGSDRWGVAYLVGSFLLATAEPGPRGERPLVVLDPANGREVGSFGTWMVAGEPRPDGRVIGIREKLGDRRVWYALLDPASRSIRVLGAAEQVTGDCQVTAEVLTCRRIDATIGVWPLIAK